MGRLYAAARLYVNFFQPSFKLKEKRREGAKVIKRYHAPSTPCERALAHPNVAAAVKKRLREQHRTLDPVALLAEIRAAQEELGNRVDRRAGDTRRSAASQPMQSSAPDAVVFARTLGTTAASSEPRATHRRPKRLIRRGFACRPKLDPQVGAIEAWLAAEPQLTAIAIVGRLSEKHPDQFGTRQHSIVQRLLKVLRKKAAKKLMLRSHLTPQQLPLGPGLWTARPMEGPTRPQPVPSSTLRNCRVAIDQ